jgi:hypothetical protein
LLGLSGFAGAAGAAGAAGLGGFAGAAGVAGLAGFDDVGGVAICDGRGSPVSSTVKATRRFLARPSAVALLSTGSLSPKPFESRRSRATPLLTR